MGNRLEANHLIAYGGFWAYDKAATLTLAINTQNVYHALHNITASPADIVTGLLQGWTFNKGRNVDTDIANIKDGAGGLLRIECSGPHLLTTNDVVAITKENRVAGNNKIVKVNVIDSTHFDCQGLSYASGTQTSTAEIDEPAYLQCGVGAGGVYHANFACSFTSTNAKVIKMELNVGVTAWDNVVAERTATGTVDTYGANGHITVLDGERVHISCKNKSGVEDVTITHANLNLLRVG